MLSLAKSKLRSVEVVIWKPLPDSNSSHHEFVLINNSPKKIDDRKKETKYSNDK